MASSSVKGFFRKGGRVIPIRAATGASHAGRAAKIGRVVKTATHAGVAAVGVNQIRKSGLKSKEIKVNRALDMTAIGLSVASGVVAASTFTGGWKSMVGGAVASHVIDAAGIAANVASVAGRGNGRARAEQAAKQEGRNFLIGNAVWGAGLVGIKKNRKELAGYAEKILEFGRKAVRVASEVVE